MSPKKKTKTTIYIDGASRGNPGPASVGVVFVGESGEVEKTLSRRIGTATNNTAEYCALILALQEAAMMRLKDLAVFTDSELLARQWSGEYKIKEESLKVLYVLASHLRAGFDTLTVTHVPREQNKLADREANRALDGDFLV